MSETRPYWKPEPKLWDWGFWSLLIPGALWVCGVIVYGAQAMAAQDWTWAGQNFGSALMVVGGESGTLFTVMEVYRKSKSGDANGWDWSGIVVSLLSTLGVLLVIFTRQTPLTAAWIEPVRKWGPLVLLLGSALDFYANVIELGYYRASFEQRWEKWNQSRWEHTQRERRKVQELDEPARESPKREPTKADKHEILAKLSETVSELTPELWNDALDNAGFVQDKPSTARYWAGKTRINSNGHGEKVRA